MKLLGDTFTGNRKEQMIKILQSDASVGAFLFFLYGKIGEQQPGFVLPAGITQEDAKAFAKEFLILFGKYAQKTKEERKK